MRKSIASILIFVLIFTFVACGRSVEEPTQTTAEQETTVEPVSGNSTEDQTAFFQLSALPDIGEHKDRTVTDRWYDTYQDHLIPRDDYGTLVPFIGEMQDLGVPNYMDYMDDDDVEDDDYENYTDVESTVCYGLMTADGKIVVDAAYRSIWMRTAPNGEKFYEANVYLQTNVPASTNDKYKESIKNRKSYIMDIKGSKILEVPCGCYCEFTKDRVVVAPDLYGSDEDGVDMDTVKIYDIKDFKLVNQLSCKALSGLDPYEDFGGISIIGGGILEYRGMSGNFFCDLDGNRVLEDEDDLSNAWSYGDYIVLSYNKYAPKVIDVNGNDCLPDIYGEISLCSISNASENEYLLCVMRNGTYQCYDQELRPVGRAFDEWPSLVKMFGRIYCRTQNPQESNLTYYDFETGEKLDWSKYTSFDLSQFEADYQTEYKTPTVVGSRYFVHGYERRSAENGYESHTDVIDLKSGKTVIEATEKNTEVFGDRWLLLSDYFYETDRIGLVFDTQTGRTIEQAKGLEIREVNGVPYCLFMRNGYSIVKNIKTQKTLLSMFITSAG